MRWKNVGILMAMLASCQLATAKDAYDMGEVQVIGKDAQTNTLTRNSQDIALSMGEKSVIMPEAVPEEIEPEALPLAEKAFPVASPRPKADEMRFGLSRGGSGTEEYVLRGKGSYNGYVGNFAFDKYLHDGFKSNIDDKKYSARAEIKSLETNGYELTFSGELTGETFGQRGLKSRPTPNAEIQDTLNSLSVEGHSTLPNGAFFQGDLQIDSGTRKAKNTSVGYSEKDTLFSSALKLEYKSELATNLTGKAEIDIKKASWSPDYTDDQDFTKRVVGVSTEYDFNGRSYLELGIKGMGLMGKSETSPFARYDYRWAKPWQFILQYDEDLRNDDVLQIFMPHRYVTTSELQASHLKRTSGKVSYNGKSNDFISLELFSEHEDDALEYVDEYLERRGFLASQYRFVPKARRKGTKIKGGMKLDEHCSLRAALTLQNPENDDTGARLSYEAKRLFDITLAYDNDRWQGEFSRHAAYDRIAYIPSIAVDVEDYSRSDLTIRYKISPKMHAYLKVKDLYDEAKSLRYGVAEEGRVSLAGLEANF